MISNKYRLGLVSVSFRNHSPEEILQAMQAAGLSYIEWGSDVHAPCQDVNAIKELAELQKKYGITCSSYGTYFSLGKTPTDTLRAYIAAAKLLGTDVLRVWCGEKSGENMSKEETEALLMQCHEAAEIARENDVTLCMECHQQTFTERLQDAELLLREVGSPHFQMYWQPFQWKTEEDNLAYAQKVSESVLHLHVFQWKGSERFSLENGIEEWRMYLQKFKTPRTLLLEFMPDDCITSLAREVAALKKIIGE